jgi:hypothetical protein
MSIDNQKDQYVNRCSSSTSVFVGLTFTTLFSYYRKQTTSAVSLEDCGECQSFILSASGLSRSEDSIPSVPQINWLSHSRRSVNSNTGVPHIPLNIPENRSMNKWLVWSRRDWRGFLAVNYPCVSVTASDSLLVLCLPTLVRQNAFESTKIFCKSFGI